MEGLSPREQEILSDVLEGYSNEEISRRRFIELTTIKSHLASLYYKFGVNSRSKLITKIYKEKLRKIRVALAGII